jgi:hypothetical protein
LSQPAEDTDFNRAKLFFSDILRNGLFDVPGEVAINIHELLCGIKRLEDDNNKLRDELKTIIKLG